MSWINEPILKDLAVAVEGSILTFTDLTNNESVIVQNPSAFKPLFTVNNFEPQPTRYVKGNGMTKREVFHYATRHNATWLRAGLTRHKSIFSSLPHDFETRPVGGFEEVFYFSVVGDGILEGKGLWSDGTPANAAWRFTNGQLACVPMGFHRVVALPSLDGHVPTVEYIWCYLCRTPEWEKE